MSRVVFSLADLQKKHTEWHATLKMNILKYLLFLLIVSIVTSNQNATTNHHFINLAALL
jgi:hypothetical protein